MPEPREDEVERLKQDVDVQQALEQATGKPVATRPVEKKRLAWVAAHLCAVLVFAALYWVLRLRLAEAAEPQLFQRLALAAMLAMLVFAVARPPRPSGSSGSPMRRRATTSCGSRSSSSFSRWP